MARNGSGTYTVPNTFSPGDTISSSDHNENFDDLGDEITNSVAADGQTTMTGPLKAASGTAAAPSITFGADTDSGLYRAGGNELGIAAGGASVALYTTATAHFYGALVVSATASFGAIGGDISISGRLAVSATATFTTGFIASATATFTSELIASATATFTTEAKVAGSPVVKQSDAASTAEVAAETAGAAKYLRADRAKHQPGAAKAWCVIQPGGTTILDSYNVTSITRDDTGRYTLTFTNAMASANYAVFVTAANDARMGYVSAKSTTACTVRTLSLSTLTDADPSAAIHVVVFGDI